MRASQPSPQPLSTCQTINTSKRRTSMRISRLSTILISIAMILSLALAGAPVRADVVTDWNVIANNAIPAGGLNFPAIQGSRILAMTHAAIHDALNAVDRRYKPYAPDRR